MVVSGNLNIKNKVNESDIILIGTVSNVGSPIEEDQISEHNPIFTSATVKIDSTLKGTTDDEIHIFFSNSYDVSWYQSPKLKIGDKGIFFLNQKKVDKDKAVYMVIKPDDFQVLNIMPMDKLDEIKKYIKNSTMS